MARMSFHLPSDVGYGFTETEHGIEETSGLTSDVEERDFLTGGGAATANDEALSRRLAHSRAGSGELLEESGGQRPVKRSKGSELGRGRVGCRGDSHTTFSHDARHFPIRVTDGKNTTKIAGKIAWKVRRNEELTPLSAKGPGAVATAMGVISKAREFLDKDGRDLLLIPSVLEDTGGSTHDRGHRHDPTIIFTLFPSSRLDRIEREGDVAGADERRENASQRLKVTNRSKVAKVAGAIAGRARAISVGDQFERQEGVWLECSGDEAAEILMLSLVKGRIYLREDGLEGRHLSYRVLVHLEQARGERGAGRWRWILRCLLN